jgi:ergothioneine biosynthesis protein EgtB
MHGARRRSDELFDIVRGEFLYDRPIPQRHRIIFYVGHLEAFDWNLLRERFGLSSFAPGLDKLFAFGIDPVGGGLPDDTPKDWPSVAQVRRYVTQSRQRLDNALLAMQAKDMNLDGQGRLLDVAIEHRLMHAETLCYMLHQLPIERKYPRRDVPLPASHALRQHGVKIPAGHATLGMPRDPEGPFGWDNEYEASRLEVPPFEIDAYNVSNQDYLDFMLAGGYREKSLWTDSGWDWIVSQEREHPVFWVRNGESWNYRTMFKEIPLPLDWPVYVSQEEASAYARWTGKELPSEAEWHRAAYASPSGVPRAYPWGYDAPGLRQGNFDFFRWDPAPIGTYPEGNSAYGVADLIGNGWEWTRTPFAPLPGFEASSFYPGYSANFYDGKHFVMKGGSPRTAACMLRKSFRNWFQPQYPYVYASFRCVKR